MLSCDRSFDHAVSPRYCLCLPSTVCPQLTCRDVSEIELSERRECHGIHPRKCRRGLRVLATEALRLRDMQPATEAELADSTEAAHEPFERSRRLSLLEPLLGELMEVLCTLDRAMALEEAGMAACVFRAFETGVSDRDLAILAEPAPLAEPAAQLAEPALVS